MLQQTWEILIYWEIKKNNCSWYFKIDLFFHSSKLAFHYLVKIYLRFLPPFFLCFLTCDVFVFPSVYSQDLKFPTNIEELSDMARFLSHFKDKHWHRVLSLFVVAYIYKQTFAIPGSVFLVRFQFIMWLLHIYFLQRKHSFWRVHILENFFFDNFDNWCFKPSNGIFIICFN